MPGGSRSYKLPESKVDGASYQQLKLTTIARKITSHLARLADDEEFQNGREDYQRFSRPAARRASNKVAIRTRHYYSEVKISKDEAIAYLRWLDRGGQGSVYDMRRESR